MPVYLAHGFRWPRTGFTGIRPHATLHNLDDAAVEYIQEERTQQVLLQSFRDLFPVQMKQLEDARTGKTLRFLEQYDPEDEQSDAAVSQPYAFVADRIVTIAAGLGDRQPYRTTTTSPQPLSDANSKPSSSPIATKKHASSSLSGSSSFGPCNPAALSLNVEEAISNGPAVTPQAWEALAELRDNIAEGEKIGWWIVYNGDPDRSFEPEQDEYESSESGEEVEEEEGAKTPTQSEPYAYGILGQALPSMLPAELKEMAINKSKEPIGTAIPHPPPALEKPLAEQGQATPRPKSSRGFINPLSLRRKSSKGNLPPPKDDDIPEPPKLKELNQKDGFRHRFFGSKK